MAKTPITIRGLAAALRLSRATVSCALRGSGRVSASTRQRVREAAQRAGYLHNPLTAKLMSELRRSRGGTFQGVLALLELNEPDRPGGHGLFHRELLRGAQDRAIELGFKTEHFEVGYDGLTLARLDSILQSRGIHGLMLAPSWHAPDFSTLNWLRYAGIYTDYNPVKPSLHSVCSDHYSSMFTMLETLQARGYRRPGLFLEDGRNERLHRRHTAAFRAFYDGGATDFPPVPPLITPQLSRPEFEHWFRHFQPDVVLCHLTQVISWMESCGAQVPKTHGFVCMNLMHKTRACAALDLQPREIGVRGIELVIAQLYRNERGIPETPTRSIIPSRWIDGPTVRG